jgi:hypothetical protein
VSPLAFCMRCYAFKNHKFLLSKGPPIGSPLLFVCGATHVKSIMVRDVNQEPLTDLYTLVR